MQSEIIISGFGGQGVLFAGQLLAYAAMDSDLHVTWIPSYGPEMRGGTANCTVIIATEEIGSPTVRHPRSALVLNLPSYQKYEPLVVAGGNLIVNSSLVEPTSSRTDIQAAYIPANDIAEEIGNKRLVNMVMLGGWLRHDHILDLEKLEKALRDHLPKRHLHLLEMNFQALKNGFDCCKESSSTQELQVKQEE
jgi:2-oxoglutarate ferredoxin oxidoreductase subunit gamma